MLTGDKLETAESIGYSCKLISADMELIRVASFQDLRSEFTELKSQENLQKMKKG